MLCPRCQYDLAGLPEVHTCPECGFEFDPHAIFIRLKVKRGLLNQVLIGVILFAALVHFGGSPGLRKENVGLALLIVIATIPPLIRILAPERISLTVNRFGIGVEGEHDEDMCISWKDIRSVRFSWISGNIVIRGPKPKRLAIAYLQIGGFFIARRLAKQIDRLRKIYSVGS
jgi:hypothetical protein